MAYKKNSIYRYLPAASKAFIDAFADNSDHDEVFKQILLAVKKITPYRKAYKRQSQYRVLLRDEFKLSPADLMPLKATAEQSAKYNAELMVNRKPTPETTINRSLLQTIIDSSITANLLCRSGLRISELINNVDIVDGVPHATISKTRRVVKLKLPMNILGSTSEWIDMYKLFKESSSGVLDNTVVSYVNVAIRHAVPKTFPKRSSHLCRAIYAAYRYKFDNDDKNVVSASIRQSLNHTTKGSAENYQYIKLSADCKGIFNPINNEDDSSKKYTAADLKLMKVKDMKQILKKRNVSGRSKIRRRADIIAAILT